MGEGRSVRQASAAIADKVQQRRAGWNEPRDAGTPCSITSVVYLAVRVLFFNLPTQSAPVVRSPCHRPHLRIASQVQHLVRRVVSSMPRRCLHRLPRARATSMYTAVIASSSYVAALDHEVGCEVPAPAPPHSATAALRSQLALRPRRLLHGWHSPIRNASIEAEYRYRKCIAAPLRRDNC